VAMVVAELCASTHMTVAFENLVCLLERLRVV
jgi:hypothetical protein